MLPKTYCDFKIIILIAADMDSESTAGGVKINILPPPIKPWMSCLPEGTGLHGKSYKKVKATYIDKLVAV